MLSLHLFAYNLFIKLYHLSIRMASPFSPKAKRWIQGREKLLSRLSLNISSIHGKKIWFHCASLGEFEQARPLMEKIKREHPDHKLILTFFSPSGYDVRRYFEGVDYVSYLPLDTPENARRFVGMMKPSVVIWVKYEYWYHHLHEIHRRNIPLIIISSVFRKEHIFFKKSGELHRKMLGFFTHIFVQNKESKELLQSIGVESEVCSDTRFDRVREIAEQRKKFENIAAFKGDKKILIAGSTWPKDISLLRKLINNDPFPGQLKYIIAPHEVNVDTTEYLPDVIKRNVGFLSRTVIQNAADFDVVVVDGIGSLASLYYYGDIAYIGGGFGASVHNILEPAVYGMPVIFGPNHQKSDEAQAMLSHKDWHAAFSVTDYDELVATIRSLLENDEKNLNTGKVKSREYVLANTGGTDMIYSYLIKKGLL